MEKSIMRDVYRVQVVRRGVITLPKGLRDRNRIIAITTLAGLLMAESGHLPAVAERIACAGWIFEILDLDGKRIDKVLAQPDSLAQEG